MRVAIFRQLFETFLIVRRSARDMVKKMYNGLRVKYSSFVSDFNKAGIFSRDFSKNTQISYFTKIRPVGAELFHANRRTDMTKLTVAFRNYFANAPKNN